MKKKQTKETKTIIEYFFEFFRYFSRVHFIHMHNEYLLFCFNLYY